MGDRVELLFRRAALRLIPRDGSVLVAVSGGADSVALLHLLRGFAIGRRLRLTVAHLDHRLRRGATADYRFVRRLSRELDLPCISERADVAALRRRDESPEESARRVRRQFLLRAAEKSGSSSIATGHTLDDQAETVLMRLVRGAGATALTGMAARGPGAFVKPLLEIERADLRAYLGARQLEFREDPSNRDLRFDRNRVRRLVLPVLAETLNPRAARHLVKAARAIRDDAVFLDALAAERLEQLGSADAAGGLSLQVPGLADAPEPIATRVARLALERAGADPRRIAARHVEALVELARGAGGRQLHLPGRLIARRAGRRITLRRES